MLNLKNRTRSVTHHNYLDIQWKLTQKWSAKSDCNCKRCTSQWHENILLSSVAYCKISLNSAHKHKHDHCIFFFLIWYPLKLSHCRDANANDQAHLMTMAWQDWSCSQLFSHKCFFTHKFAFLWLISQSVCKLCVVKILKLILGDYRQKSKETILFHLQFYCSRDNFKRHVTTRASRWYVKPYMITRKKNLPLLYLNQEDYPLFNAKKATSDNKVLKNPT